MLLKGFWDAAMGHWQMVEVTPEELDLIIAKGNRHLWPPVFDKNRRHWPPPPPGTDVVFYETRGDGKIG